MKVEIKKLLEENSPTSFVEKINGLLYEKVGYALKNTKELVAESVFTDIDIDTDTE